MCLDNYLILIPKSCETELSECAIYSGAASFRLKKSTCNAHLELATNRSPSPLARIVHRHTTHRSDRRRKRLEFDPDQIPQPKRQCTPIVFGNRLWKSGQRISDSDTKIGIARLGKRMSAFM
jgi:hypothetical protein